MNFKDLLEIEAGLTRNEPAQLGVKEAIEAAVIHLIVQGLKDGNWQLDQETDWNSDIIQRYLKTNDVYPLQPI